MKFDLKKDLKEYYQPRSGDFTEVTVPARTYLAIDGHGDPNVAPEYADAVESLFTVAYSVRAAFKARGDDFVVGPLEGLWSAPDPNAFVTGDKSSWDWTMLIPLPDAVMAADIEAGLVAAIKKKPHLPIARVAPLRLDEGRSLQIMHIGSYDGEAPTLARLHHEVMPAAGLTFNGRHHEIYLGDPRKVEPDKLKTVLRQPVKPG